jgi:NADP-dependent 3-hydroxy acid dehydrogenase YdfG
MKAVLITGASSGLGKALAQYYLGRDFKVFGTGRNTEALSSLADQYAHFHPITLDVTNKRDCIDKLGAIEGGLDLAILNAGNCEYIQLEYFDSDIVARIMDVNVNGVAHCVEALLPKLSAGSKLAVVSSSVTYLPLAQAEAYGASKAAVDYFTRTLALSLKQRSIATSLIQPGFVDTPLTEKNRFKMPFLMKAEDAAAIIGRGLDSNQTLIAFPKRLIYTLKLLSWLPDSVSHKLLNG